MYNFDTCHQWLPFFISCFLVDFCLWEAFFGIGTDYTTKWTVKIDYC